MEVSTEEAGVAGSGEEEQEKALPDSLKSGLSDDDFLCKGSGGASGNTGVKFRSRPGV